MIRVGDPVLVSASVSEVRSNGIIIVRSSEGDYFGVGKDAVSKDPDNRILLAFTPVWYVESGTVLKGWVEKKEFDSGCSEVNIFVFWHLLSKKETDENIRKHKEFWEKQ